MWFDDTEIYSIGMTVTPSSSASSGISQLTQCSQIANLPELPASDEERLLQAALSLQQKLILRQWMSKFSLLNYYPRLLALNVNRLDDVYWFENSKASHVLSKDYVLWSNARQSLPTTKQELESLKADLWSEVVKSTNHQDAWTWGGMLIVSVSIAGLVTLAAMTQPSLAPEAKHTLLQYVTGKYLMPSNCKVTFHWNDMHPVGHTVCFTVHFYQRNGQPYPICDTDQLTVEVSDGTRKVITKE
ncbi:uncharacterized protein LOC108738064 isoform X2 [Agrilus planipennis]|uniref:Uncharacterized protein LOC108738064 isoform X2 n=1 Tax=Agrilus planipennis TaxID=224129 RepID=A0A7F5R6G4_AGRPL|nr:uncharacterized protein LOC108738064 isoform X2 [Agrilus planipennis]